MKKVICIKDYEVIWNNDINRKEIYFYKGKIYEYILENDYYMVSFKIAKKKKTYYKFFTKDVFYCYFKNDLQHNRKLKLLNLNKLYNE